MLFCMFGKEVYIIQLYISYAAYYILFELLTIYPGFKNNEYLAFFSLKNQIIRIIQLFSNLR